MASEGSVSNWIRQLQAGDNAAVQKLWERYFQRLVGLAKKKLQGFSLGVADEEDVALSALDSFFRRVEQGGFPQLSDRDDLWRLLFTITVRKAFQLVRDERRHKRGGGRMRGDSALGGPDRFASREPAPDDLVPQVDRIRTLFEKLGEPELRVIALMKMEGFRIEEIVGSLDCAPRTVQRKLLVIRSIWQRELAP